MKINPEIYESIKYNPTKRTYQMSIFDACQKIKNEELTLPLYQRDLSWTLNKAVALFNYQLFGKAPIAPISINEMDNTSGVTQVTFINREPIETSKIRNRHESVVDGQQRLTTNYKAFVNDSSFENIVLDITKGTFRLINGKKAKTHVPVGILLNEDIDVLKNFLKNNKTTEVLYSILVDVRSKLGGYNYTVNIAENLNEKEQIEWFEVLNNAGSKVSAIQMSFSKIKTTDFDIYADYTLPYGKIVAEYGFEELFTPYTSNVSYPISTLNPAYEILAKNGIHSSNFAPIPSDSKEKIITKLEISKLKEMIDLTLKSLEKALKFIATNSLNGYINRMDYVMYLSGYFCYHSDDDLKKEEIAYLINWIKNVDFTNASNGIRRKIFSDLIKD